MSALLLEILLQLQDLASVVPQHLCLFRKQEAVQPGVRAQLLLSQEADLQGRLQLLQEPPVFVFHFSELALVNCLREGRAELLH